MTAPVHLVLGDDPTLRSDVVRALITELVGADDPSLALEDFALAGRADDGAGEGDTGTSDGRPSVIATALGAASTPPFGTERRVIVLREVGALGAADTDAVVRYLADPMPTTVLVLVAGGGRTPAALTKAVKAAGGQEVRPSSERTGDALGSAVAGPDGSVRTEVRIPDRTAAGPVTVDLVGDRSAVVADVVLQVAGSGTTLTDDGAGAGVSGGVGDLVPLTVAAGALVTAVAGFVSVAGRQRSLGRGTRAVRRA